MLTFLRDPGADGVGVTFTSAETDLGDLQGAEARDAAFARLAAHLGVAVAFVTQVHGNDVLSLDEPPASPVIDLTAHRVDALVTSLRGVALAVRVADCVPVLLADPAAGVVGAAHAGRAGVLAGVVPRAVEAMRVRGASDLVAWIGPHICAECYEVPAAMAADYADATGVAATTTSWGTPSIDLGAAVRRQLDACGVRWSREEACTRTDPHLHSYRRDAAASGRLAGLVWLA